MKSTASDRRSNGRPLGIEMLEARDLLAADFELLKDINQTPPSWNWLQGVEVGSRSYLVAGVVLWSTDGTSAGSYQVHEAATTIRDLTNVNGTLFFAADSRFTPNGVELWKSDGTPAGTMLVKEIVPNDPNLTFTAEPRFLTNVNGTLFFSAYGGSAVGNELWKSDGSESGTVLVADIRAGTNGSYPSQLTNLNGTLYFMNGSDGGRIWKSDGTAAGTIAAETTTTRPVIYSYTKVNGTLFFTSQRQLGFELWKYDSATKATSLVAGINPAWIPITAPHSLVNVGGTLFFVANDGVHGPELWKSDGTAAGTGMVKDVFAATNDSEHIQALTVVGETLFFHAREGAGDRRLWKSDGTTAGTIPVSLEPLGAPGGFVIHPYASMTEAGGKLYFQAYEPSSGTEVWSSDGTLAGTRLAYDAVPGPTSTRFRFLTDVDDNLLFTSWDGVLWKGDEQGTGATILNMPTNKTGSSMQIGDPIAFNYGVTFFTANDGIHGRELWRTDGTEAGTWLVKDVTPGSAGSHLRHFTVVGNLLFFTNENYDSFIDADAELWRSDGTAAGTTLITKLDRWTEVNSPRELVNVNGTLFFNGDTPLASTGVELWKSDGTVAGTKAVTDMIPTGFTFRVAHLSNVNGTLLFRGYQEATGPELWRSDGTAGGTTLVKNILTGSLGALGYEDAMPKVVADGILYFRAEGSGGDELWRSDGTANGTYQVKDINAGGDGSNVDKFCVVNNTIYFTAESETDFNEALWKTDGTAAGTVRVYSHSAINGSARYLTNVDGTLFFTADRSWEGRELWKSDGTSAGTMLVKDIRIGKESGGVSRLTSFGGKLYFSANDGMHGTELWCSDGTAAGTVMVRDVVAGAWSGSSPLFVADGRLFLVTTAEPYGSELWISTPERQGPADFDENGRVDGTDFLAWQRSFGATADPAGSGADGDGNGTVGSEDLGVWQNIFGAGDSASGSAAAAGGASELAMAALVADEEAVDDGEEQSGADVGSAADAAFAWLAAERATTDQGGWKCSSVVEVELLARDWAARSSSLAPSAKNERDGDWKPGDFARKLRTAELSFGAGEAAAESQGFLAATLDEWTTREGFRAATRR